MEPPVLTPIPIPADSVASLALGRLQQVLYRLTSEENDQVDRVLAGLTLVAGAAVIAWPVGHRAPRIVTQGGAVARQLWARRSWWLPGEQ